MATYELKKINIKSLVKNFPIVFAVVGTIIGLFTFFIVPTEVASTLTIGTRFLSWIIFIVLYTLLMVLGLMIISLLYNWIAGMVGGVIVDFEEKQ